MKSTSSPPGATSSSSPKAPLPVDFAFAVHTDVGFHCMGARVDGQMVPLSTPLQTGKTVEVITSPHQHPSRDWLTYVKSARARSRIRRWLKDEEHAHSVRLTQHPERILELDRDVEAAETFAVHIQVTGTDRPNFLRDVTRAIADMGVPIIGGELTTAHGQVGDRFLVEVKDRHQLNALFKKVLGVPGVAHVQRVDEAEGEA